MPLFILDEGNNYQPFTGTEQECQEWWEKNKDKLLIRHTHGTEDEVVEIKGKFNGAFDGTCLRLYWAPSPNNSAECLIFTKTFSGETVYKVHKEHKDEVYADFVKALHDAKLFVDLLFPKEDPST
jgi:hypothetical protein